MNIYIYTDGSAINNGKKNAIGGYGVYFPKYPDLNVSEPYKFPNSIPTNQKTELYAIYIALLQSMKIKNIKDCNIHIYSDSSYSINCITKWIPTWIKNNWKKADNTVVKNIELLKIIWIAFNNLKSNCKDIKFHHINSHTGKKDEHSIGNDVADKFANAGTFK